MIVHPSLLKRKIIHFDMDAFYAAVEVRENPSLKGKPLVVGGAPNSRGVVCTASYEARKFGIRSAMPCSRAARLCPDLIFVPPDFKKYQATSKAIRKIFGQYTSVIEPLSLDEAFLDVTENTMGFYASKIARLIQQQIYEELGLTGSAGVAPNKLLAKIASDINKPFGMAVIVPQVVLGFMETLPLKRIHGVGPSSSQRLEAEGYVFCKDVWTSSADQMQRLFGKMGRWIWERAQGIDERPVEVSRVRKSLGKELTFSEDILDFQKLTTCLEQLVQSVVLSLKSKSLMGKCITLKCRYSDFTLITRSHTFSRPLSAEREILESALRLMSQTHAGCKPVRLLGITVSQFDATSSCLEKNETTPSLFT